MFTDISNIMVPNPHSQVWGAVSWGQIAAVFYGFKSWQSPRNFYCFFFFSFLLTCGTNLGEVRKWTERIRGHKSSSSSRLESVWVAVTMGPDVGAGVWKSQLGLPLQAFRDIWEQALSSFILWCLNPSSGLSAGIIRHALCHHQSVDLLKCLYSWFLEG